MELFVWPVMSLLQVAFAMLWPSKDPEIHNLQRKAAYVAIAGVVVLIAGGSSFFLFDWRIALSVLGVGYALLIYSGYLGARIEARAKADYEQAEARSKRGP